MCMWEGGGGCLEHMDTDMDMGMDMGVQPYGTARHWAAPRA